MRDIAATIRSSSSSALDRATDKMLEAYVQLCEARVPDAEVDDCSRCVVCLHRFRVSHVSARRAEFLALAPGLGDFFNLLAEETKSAPRRAAKPLSNAASRLNKTSGGARMSGKVDGARKKKRKDESESESDESSEDNDEESEEESVDGDDELSNGLDRTHLESVVV